MVKKFEPKFFFVLVTRRKGPKLLHNVRIIQTNSSHLLKIISHRGITKWGKKNLGTAVLPA